MVANRLRIVPVPTDMLRVLQPLLDSDGNDPRPHVKLDALTDVVFVLERENPDPTRHTRVIDEH